MPRIFSTVALALFVLAAQFGALPHQISHGLASGSGGALTAAGSRIAQGKAVAADPAGTEKDSYCEKCFQFANVHGAGFSGLLAFALLTLFPDAACSTQAAEQPCDPPQTRSRGPPALL